jgi:hypothetical protein
MHIRRFTFIAVILSVVVIFWGVHFNYIAYSGSPPSWHLATGTARPDRTIGCFIRDIDPQCGVAEPGLCPS